MQTQPNNLKKIIHSALLVVGAGIVAYFVTGMFLLVSGVGDSYAGNDFAWDELLASDKQHSISCDNSTYMLLIKDPKKSEPESLNGVYIGSSVKDLNQFCGKTVKISAVPRSFKSQPLCTEQNKQEHPDFCNAKVPVVDITSIESI